MTRILAYCAFLHNPAISLPEIGVAGAKVQEIAHGELKLLWSDVEWPFPESTLQASAMEFHQVVSHIFSQTGVAPFRLLSVFDDQQSLADFIAAHQAGFVADLKRLQHMVQMECVLYFAPQAGVRPTGTEYLQRKAELLQRTEEFVGSMKHALADLACEIRVRESRTGGRIFVLVQRGNEKKFASIVQELPIPERLARRTSGPWPPAEFLSGAVKTPPVAGPK